MIFAFEECLKTDDVQVNGQLGGIASVPDSREVMAVVRWWRTSPAGWTRTSLPTRSTGVRKPSTCNCWSEFSECLKRATLLVEAKQKVDYREGGRSGFPNQRPGSGRSTALSDQTLGAHSKGRVARGCSETLAQPRGLGRGPVNPRLGTSVAILLILPKRHG